MARLSLCMIVRDEERFLAGALESVRGAVDEVLVVDTGSKDGTRAITERHGARVIDFAWCDDFSAARNAGLEAASGTHLLVLDADERIASGAASKLRAAIHDKRLLMGMLPLHDADALDAPEADVLSGARRLQDPIWLPRLFRNDPRLRYERRVHETLFRDIEKKRRLLGGEFLAVEAPIVHLGEVKSLRAGLNKAERNTRLLEIALAEDPADGDLAGYLATEYTRVQRWEEAEALGARTLPLFLEALDALPPKALKPSPIQLAGVLATAQLRRGAPADALATVTSAAQRCQEPHPNLLFLEGAARERTGDLAGAERCLRAALALAGKRFTIAVNHGTTGGAAKLRLANVLLAAKRAREVLPLLEDLGGKYALPAALARAEAWMQLGEGPKALDLLGEMLARPDPPADLYALAAWAGTLLGMPDPALAEAARKAPVARFQEPRRRALVDG